MNTLRQKLIKKFRDRKYRQVYVDSFLDTYVSTQIRALREDRALSQGRLGKLIGTTQGGVSTFENTDYSSWSIRTLRKLAAAFDLALVVRFESFGSILNEITSFNRASVSRPSFKDDPAWHEHETTADLLAPATLDLRGISIAFNRFTHVPSVSILTDQPALTAVDNVGYFVFGSDTIKQAGSMLTGEQIRRASLASGGVPMDTRGRTTTYSP